MYVDFLLTDTKVNYGMFSVLSALAVLGVLVFFLLAPVTRPVCCNLLALFPSPISQTSGREP